MNIFVTHKDPKVSAKNLDDKRVNKMILESAQMLSTAVHVLDPDNISVFKLFTPEGKRRKLALHHKYGKVYMPTHVNHPCNIWIRQSRQNYMWLFYHLNALLLQYAYRSGKVHACTSLLSTLHKARFVVPDGKLTPFQNSAANSDFNVDFKHMKSTTDAYRQYLNARWPNDKREPVWTKVGRPKWANFIWVGK